MACTATCKMERNEAADNTVYNTQRIFSHSWRQNNNFFSKDNAKITQFWRKVKKLVEWDGKKQPQV